MPKAGADEATRGSAAEGNMGLPPFSLIIEPARPGPGPGPKFIPGPPWKFGGMFGTGGADRGEYPNGGWGA